MQAMMRLAEGDARTAASNGAQINGGEAFEERRGPGAVSRGGGDAGGVFGGGGGAGDPAVEVGLHFGFGGGGHCWLVGGFGGESWRVGGERWWLLVGWW